jgi:fatty-acyl-CoA synthase
MSFGYFDWIAHYAEVRGDKTALIDLTTQRRLTYGTLDERTDRLATYLASLGATNGERVAVLAPNTTDILEVQFACFRLGAIFAPLNVRLTVHELQFILRDATPVVLLYDSEFEATAIELQKLCAGRRLQFGVSYEIAIASSARLARHAPVSLDDVSMMSRPSSTRLARPESLKAS